MMDEELIEMFCSGNEGAINILAEQYGKLIYSRCLMITGRHEDAEECYNDCLYNLWIWIPRSKPCKLRLYIIRVAINVSMDLIDHNRSIKRSKYKISGFDEVEEISCLKYNMERYFESYCIRKVINRFLRDISKEKEEIFAERYFMQAKICEIAKKHNISDSSAKMILMRMRESLKKYLKEEDVYF